MFGTDFIGKLFGKDSLTDRAADGIDKVWFTGEEKADYMLKFLKAYEPFKIAQRFLALIVGIPYAIFVSIGLMMVVIGGIFGMEPLGASGINVISMTNQALGIHFSIILGFYFGGGMIEGAIRARVEK